jgi:hypothetical protein
LNFQNECPLPLAQGVPNYMSRLPQPSTLYQCFPSRTSACAAASVPRQSIGTQMTYSAAAATPSTTAVSRTLRTGARGPSASRTSKPGVGFAAFVKRTELMVRRRGWAIGAICPSLVSIRAGWSVLYPCMQRTCSCGEMGSVGGWSGAGTRGVGMRSGQLQDSRCADVCLCVCVLVALLAAQRIRGIYSSPTAVRAGRPPLGAAASPVVGHHRKAHRWGAVLRQYRGVVITQIEIACASLPSHARRLAWRFARPEGIGLCCPIDTLRAHLRCCLRACRDAIQKAVIGVTAVECIPSFGPLAGDHACSTYVELSHRRRIYSDVHRTSDGGAVLESL